MNVETDIYIVYSIYIIYTWWRSCIEVIIMKIMLIKKVTTIVIVSEFFESMMQHNGQTLSVQEISSKMIHIECIASCNFHVTYNVRPFSTIVFKNFDTMILKQSIHVHSMNVNENNFNFSVWIIFSRLTVIFGRRTSIISQRKGYSNVSFQLIWSFSFMLKRLLRSFLARFRHEIVLIYLNYLF